MEENTIIFRVEINPHPITKLRQVLDMVQVACIDTDVNYAKVKFRVSSLDKDGNVLTDPATTYEFWKDFTNDLKLDQTGRGVTIELVMASNPINEGESDEDYQSRVEEIYQASLSTAIGEFSFWMTPFVEVFQKQLERGWQLLPFPNK